VEFEMRPALLLQGLVLRLQLPQLRPDVVALALAPPHSLACVVDVADKLPHRSPQAIFARAGSKDASNLLALLLILRPTFRGIFCSLLEARSIYARLLYRLAQALVD